MLVKMVSMATTISTMVGLVLLALGLPLTTEASSVYLRCGECDVSRCPQLHYCVGQPIKDQCGCCTVCSSDKFQPHITLPAKDAEDACKQVDCPNLKVCVVNVQGLPLCTCPSEFVCRRSKKKEICGSDGHSYQSRCVMRIASCNQGVQIWKQYRGPCSEDETPLDVGTYRRKLKRLKRRRRRRRQRKRDDDTTETKDDEENQRRKKNRRRKRRKISNRNKKGRSRMRRHRKANRFNKLMSETNFGRGTWNA